MQNMEVWHKIDKKEKKALLLIDYFSSHTSSILAYCHLFGLGTTVVSIELTLLWCTRTTSCDLHIMKNMTLTQM